MSVWDTQRDFLDEYIPLMEKVRTGDKTSYSKVKALRVKEYKNTIAIVNQGYYYTADNQRVELSAMDKIAEGTQFYSLEFTVNHIAPSVDKTIVEVSNADCMAEGTDCTLAAEASRKGLSGRSMRRNLKPVFGSAGLMTSFTV